MENTAALSAKHQYKTCGFCVPLGHVKPLWCHSWMMPVVRQYCKLWDKQNG